MNRLTKRVCSVALGGLLALLLASPASAVVVRLSSGKYLSYLPVPGKRIQPPPDQAFLNLDYNGGPVMPTNTNYMLYWRPPGAPGYPPDYQPGINRYFADLAHDSGMPTNVDSVAAQLGDTFGNFATYRSYFGGALIDTHPYPTNGCLNARICLTDAQIQAELFRFVTTNHLPADLYHEYFVLTPPGVESCFDAAGTVCSVNAWPNPDFCAYHSYTYTNPTIIYANDPYVVGSACDTGQHPNGTTSDGALQGGLTHEHVESITDPLVYAWIDNFNGLNTGYEIGDKCEFGIDQYGTPLGTAPNGSPYNQVINGHLYWYQAEWSNQAHKCLQRLSFAGTAPVGYLSATPTSGTKIRFSASGSSAQGGIARYSWQFNDGGSPQETTVPTITHTFPASGVYAVALTVFAHDGTSIGTTRIVRTGDEGPTPGLSVTTANPQAGKPITFTGAPSKDPDGSVTAYTWTFGDGSVAATGQKPTHIYSTAGQYRVTLTINDKSGQQASVTRIVTVS